MNTPCYVFDSDIFAQRVSLVRSCLPKVPLTFSIKANPFLLQALPEDLAHVEVCSPGELEICESLQIDPARIIYSGVMKEACDIAEAIAYGVDILTCESIRHAVLINEAAEKTGRRVRVLLRLTCGNQFGMSIDDMVSIMESDYAYLDIIGIHYYSGTQKTLRKMQKDLEKMTEALDVLKERFAYAPQMVEYGPGLKCEYFTADREKLERGHLEECAGALEDFAGRYPLAIELGRFLASGCGCYHTKVEDIKESYGCRYAILDGGIHHLNYFGQRMAMEIPEMEVLRGKPGGQEMDYCLCGSLCTVADVLVRNVSLLELSIGDEIVFKNCGAYSVTEATGLFLSRPLPEIYLQTGGCMKRVRSAIHTSQINQGD